MFRNALLSRVPFGPCALVIAVLAALPACNNRIIASGHGEDEGEETEGEEQEPDDPDDPQPDPTCGDGVIDPGEFCHESRSQVGAGIDPCALTVADFDHDGRPDAAVPNSDFDNQDEEYHVANVLMGKGDGTLQAAQAHHAGRPLPVGIDHGDFDADGNPDLVVANWDANEINVLYGDGEGGLSAPVTIAVGESADAISAGDVDVDGYTDMVFTTSSRSAIGVILTQAGSFEPVRWIELDAPATHAMFADIDEDGAPDLIATLSFPNDVVIARGNGDGSFGGMTRSGVNYGPQWVVSSDVNGSNHADLLVANGDGTVDVLWGNGTGAFVRGPTVIVGHTLQSVVAGDFDMDGRMDFAVSDTGLDAVTFVTARDGASYANEESFSVGTRPVSIRSADFNLDGVPDVAVANQFSNTISLIVSNP